MRVRREVSHEGDHRPRRVSDRRLRRHWFVRGLVAVGQQKALLWAELAEASKCVVELTLGRKQGAVRVLQDTTLDGAVPLSVLHEGERALRPLVSVVQDQSRPESPGQVERSEEVVEARAGRDHNGRRALTESTPSGFEDLQSHLYRAIDARNDPLIA